MARLCEREPCYEDAAMQGIPDFFSRHKMVSTARICRLSGLNLPFFLPVRKGTFRPMFPNALFSGGFGETIRSFSAFLCIFSSVAFCGCRLAFVAPGRSSTAGYAVSGTLHAPNPVLGGERLCNGKAERDDRVWPGLDDQLRTQFS